MRFRKKPIVIEAEQYHDDMPSFPAGVLIFCENRPLGECPAQGIPHVHTLEGPLIVSSGDWIITGIAGERYPCKPDIFAETYEAVDEAMVGYRAAQAELAR